MQKKLNVKGHLSLTSQERDAEKLIALLDEVMPLAAVPELKEFLFRCATLEVFNNCVRHAYGEKSGLPIEVNYRLQPTRLEVTLSDRGIAFEVPQHGSPCDPMAESGRGLEIIQAGVSDVDFSRTDGWNHCRLSLQLV